VKRKTVFITFLHLKLFIFAVCHRKYSKLLVLVLIASRSTTVRVKLTSALRSVTGLIEVVNRS